MGAKFYDSCGHKVILQCADCRAAAGYYHQHDNNSTIYYPNEGLNIRFIHHSSCLYCTLPEHRRSAQGLTRPGISHIRSPTLLRISTSLQEEKPTGTGGEEHDVKHGIKHEWGEDFNGTFPQGATYWITSFLVKKAP